MIVNSNAVALQFAYALFHACVFFSPPNLSEDKRSRKRMDGWLGRGRAYKKSLHSVAKSRQYFLTRSRLQEPHPSLFDKFKVDLIS